MSHALPNSGHLEIRSSQEFMGILQGSFKEYERRGSFEEQIKDPAVWVNCRCEGSGQQKPAWARQRGCREGMPGQGVEETWLVSLAPSHGQGPRPGTQMVRAWGKVSPLSVAAGGWHFRNFQHIW